jgi:hypothetical protein
MVRQLRRGTGKSFVILLVAFLMWGLLLIELVE